jgi:hypothetical protein
MEIPCLIFMKKRIFHLALLLSILAFSLIGCKKDNEQLSPGTIVGWNYGYCAFLADSI